MALPPDRRLIRKPEKGMIAGVCAGIADFLGWDVNTVRILYVVVSVFSAAFPGLLVYVLMWLILPRS